MRDYLKQLRKQRRESQQDVANALGISRQYYCMIESGERQKRMDMTFITSLANHFGVSPAEIVSYEQAVYAASQTASSA